MQADETLRPEFEEWLNPGRHEGNVSAWVEPGRYAKETHQLAWLAWQAARAQPAPDSERELLGAAQTAAVMPLIGPLLDAWENADREVMSEEPELAKQLRRINSAMLNAEAITTPPARPSA